MYNLSPVRYQTETPGDDLSLDQLHQFIYHHNNNVVPIMDKLESYATGYNTTIKDKPDKKAGVPNNRSSYSYGKKISDTVTSYLISNPASYEANDINYINNVKTVQQINNDRYESKEIIKNLVDFGMAGKLFYYVTVDNSSYLQYASVDPREFIPIYDYSVNPKLVAVIRYYSVNSLSSVGSAETSKTYVSVYTANAITEYEGHITLNADNKTGGLQLINGPTPHNHNQVPFAVYGGVNYSGMLYHVLDQIDDLDTIENANLNELQRFELAYLVITAQISDQELKKANESRAIRLPSSMSAKDAIQYLTKEVNADFNIDSRNNAREKILELSGVPDFESKDFAAQSGVALRYKLMGFDNVAKQIEERFILGEQKAIDVVSNFLYSDWESRESFYLRYPDRIVKVDLNENLPLDVTEKLNQALIMQSIQGLPIEKILSFLPDNITGGVISKSF